MKRPLLTGVILLCFGILCGYYLQIPWAARPVIDRRMGSDLLLGCSIFLLIVLGCRFHYHRRNWKMVWIMPLFFLVGLFLTFYGLRSKSRLYYDAAVQGVPVRILGTVEEISASASGRPVAYIKADALQSPEGREDVPFKVKAYLADGDQVAVGQEILVEGSLHFLEEQRNPGGFNEFLYLKARKIDYKLYGEVVEDVGVSSSYSQFLYQLRSRFSAVFDNVLGEKESGVMQSIILGDKSALDSDIAGLYKTAGIYHVVVISGLHISILMLCIYWLFSRFFPVKASCAMTMVFLVFYCILVGGSVSAVRAVIMAGVLLLGKSIHKESDVVTSASFAMGVLLLYEPLYLFDAGFQLSFAAVYGIGFCLSPIESYLKNKGENLPWLKKTEAFRSLRSGLAASFCVSMWTAPVMMWHFNYTAAYGVFANVLILPFAAVLVSCGFLSGLIGLLSLPLARMPGMVCYGILKIYEAICLFFAQLPGTQLEIRHYSLWIVVIYYIFLLLFTWRIKGKMLSLRGWRLPAVVSGFILLIFCYNNWPADPVVTMMDVGQGDCFVIEADGKAFLVDGGGWNGYDIGENTGAKILIPYMVYAGIDRINTAFISHTDMDHCAGVMELMAAGKVDQVVLPLSADKNDENYGWIIAVAEKNNIDLLFMAAGDVLDTATGITFESLYPFSYNTIKGINENSLVLKMAYGDVDFLFTGDIGEANEALLLNTGTDIKTAVLKIAHHGSSYSTSEAFVAASSPALAIVSASAYNSYSHPSKEVRDRLEAHGIPLYVTADHGAVEIKIKNHGGLEIRAMSSKWRNKR